MMPAPLLPLFVATATLTLTSDTGAKKIYVKKPKGTLYWGGSGLDGVYIKPTLSALQKAGIKNVSVGLTNTATANVPLIGTIIDAFRAGSLIRFKDDADWTISYGMDNDSEQFNLIGYSYGSLLAAQTANFYAKSGVIVDHLVLIGSPIDGSFLNDLKANKKIKKVTVLDLKNRGDEIYAGITQRELLDLRFAKKLGEDMASGRGQGHFYYAHPIPELPQRVEALANWLVQQGLK
jgi:pimeloyl-ACP methyl ester carboxylesterase